MCTTYDPELTDKISKRLKPGPQRFWKVYKLHYTHISTLFFGFLHIHRGIIRSDCSSYPKSTFPDAIYHGIHCCITRKEAESWKGKVAGGVVDFIVPVYGSRTSFIGAGGNSAVFDLVRIKRDDLKKALEAAPPFGLSVKDLLEETYMRANNVHNI